MNLLENGVTTDVQNLQAGAFVKKQNLGLLLYEVAREVSLDQSLVASKFPDRTELGLAIAYLIVLQQQVFEALAEVQRRDGSYDVV